MSIWFSNETSSWHWTCVWGCAGYDCEGEQEAADMQLAHHCIREAHDA